ncbi:MAG: SMC-Scp complex subunit ScpB [Planctomycetia bacterium]|nr:SMC-Scp complex subunit ScpB [Planctomycetia bacterium]
MMRLRMPVRAGWGDRLKKKPEISASFRCFLRLRKTRAARRGGAVEIPLADEPEPQTRTAEMVRLETVLFLAQEPLGIRKLAQFAQLENTQAALAVIRKLNQLYDQNRYAFRILEFAGGYELRTRPQFAPWLRQLLRRGGLENQESPEIQLSQPAMETLSIIAYRQPIIRAEIESIRGVQHCGEILRLLLGKDLIRIAGRSNELGRPRLYKTTRKFLEVFGLKSLSQLPKLDEDE